jgi:hypothetical protein
MSARRSWGGGPRERRARRGLRPPPRWLPCTGSCGARHIIDRSFHDRPSWGRTPPED